LLAAPCLSPAQEGAEIEDFDDFDELYLGQLLDVVYTAAKHEQDIGESPSAITVITRADIETSGATTIPDLLRMVPGLDVVITSPLIIGIMARLPWANENNQFLVLIDGREINQELMGMSLWELEPICLEDIERIEIIRGPGSALYGANAVSGVVNITTRAIPQDTSAWTRLGAGEVGLTTAAARASTRSGNWGFSLSAEADTMGTFADPDVSGRELWKLRAVAEHRWSDSRRLLIDGGITRGTGMVAIAAGSFAGTMNLRTLRVAYESEDLKGHLYWSQTPVTGEMDAALDYSGIRLAEFIPFEVDSHSIKGEIQWTLPELWQPLLLIVGGGGRFTYLTSDQMLDADTFADMNSSRFHEPGIDYYEARTGGFVHGELSPADWVTATFGLRLDYNTETGTFLSPRLSAVFRPADDQYLRLGVARAFRKPAFIETRAHLMVEFPDESPITGAGRDEFLEFMTRVIGNGGIGNEALLSFEAGYLGRFLDDRLRFSLDLYYNIYSNEVQFISKIVEDLHGLPDLDQSSFMSTNRQHSRDIFGSELAIRFNPSDSVSLLASWTYREAIDRRNDRSLDNSPKHLLALGGRYQAGWGLVGSLYLFSRSRFWIRAVQNPEGLLEKLLKEHKGNVLLVLGRLGWRWKSPAGPEFEAGVKLFLPVSFTAPYFQFREDGGGTTAAGENFGGDLLCRMVSLYLQGSF
jgi:iron complex outermembrane receptor protein